MTSSSMNIYKQRLNAHHKAVETSGLIAALTAVLVGIYWIDNTWMQAVLGLAWVCLAVFAALYLKERVTSSVLLSSVMYVLVASTFLNQELLTVSAGFFTLFIYRLLLLAAVIVFLIHAVRVGGFADQWERTPVKGVLFFLLFWLGWATASLVWSWSIVEAMKYLLLIGIGIVFVFLAVFTFTSVRQMLAYHTIWLIMCAVLIGIGFVNYFARIQLPTSSLYGGAAYKQMYPTAVFTNQNDFATLLAIVFFFYLAAAKNYRQPFVRMGGMIMAALSLWLIFLTESRASLLGVIAGGCFYLFLLLPKKWKKPTAYSVSALAVCGLIALSGKLFGKLMTILSTPAVYSVNTDPSSNVVRVNLLQSAAHYLTNSFGIGTGSGNIPVYLENQPIRDTAQIFEVHNWLMELTGNFGLLIGIGYVAMYAALFVALMKVHARTSDRRSQLLVESCLSAQIAFLISSISPSSVSNLYYHWVFLGFVICTVSVLYQINSRERLKE